MCKTYNQFVISEDSDNFMSLTNRDSKLIFSVRQGFSSSKFVVSDLEALKELHSFLGSYIKQTLEKSPEAKETVTTPETTDTAPVFSRVI